MTIPFSLLVPALAIGTGAIVCVLVLSGGTWMLAAYRQRVVERVLLTFVPTVAAQPTRTIERGFARALLRWDQEGRLRRALVDADVHIRPSLFLVWLVAATTAVVLVLAGPLDKPGAIVSAGGCVPPVLVFVFLLRRRAAARHRLAEQFPRLFTVLGSALQAGCSVPQAIEQTAQEMPAPVGPLLARARDAQRLGRSLEDVLAEIGAEAHFPTVEVAITAMLIHRQTGGNLGPLLLDAAELMQEDLRLRRELHVATAQARLSAQIVGGLPVVIVAALMFLSPDSLEPFYSSTLGTLMLVAAGVLDLVGFVLVVRASHVAF